MNTFQIAPTLSARINLALVNWKLHNRRSPRLLYVGEQFMDLWRAELLCTGKLRPRQALLFFKGVAVCTHPDVSEYEIRG